MLLLKKIQLHIKRLLDIFVAVFAVILLSPVYLLVAIYIMVNSKGKIIFKQERAGINGKPFICYKFRTMTEERGEDGELLPDEHRLQHWGMFLRSTSLDEIPQFLNILKGDMSLIGPRALPTNYIPLYNSEQIRRLKMRPGMTSLPAIKGRNNIDWDKKLDLDTWYVDNWSLLLDINIFFLTFVVLLKRTGINQEGYITTREFKGSDNKASSSINIGN